MQRLLILLVSILPVALYSQGLGIQLKNPAKEQPKKQHLILSQSLHGRVFDKDTRLPIENVFVLLTQAPFKNGALSDTLGNFVFSNVPVGRYVVKVSYLGYKLLSLPVLVTSVRPANIEIPLEVSPVQLQEVLIRSMDESAPVGGNLINTDDLDRHAGNRGGEAIRKVSILPGIQNADDSRNDVIVRGNSPQSVIWRLEGVNIPNPNHFTIAGTSGGPLSVISDKTLANSTFYSGAFPAEFGNSTSAIFDLRFRNGDSTQYHATGQFGLLGAEISSDGPLSSRHKSSYLFSIRHSTLGLFKNLNIDIGTEAVPVYADASYKLNFPLKNRSSLSLFGMGGNSSIDIVISDQFNPNNNIYGEKDRDQYLRTKVYVTGATYRKQIREHASLFATVAYSRSDIKSHHNFVYPPQVRDSMLVADGDPTVLLPPVLGYRFIEDRLSANIQYRNRVSRKCYFNVGLITDIYFFDYVDSLRNTSPYDVSWRIRWQTQTTAALVQPFVQFKYTGKKMDLLAGVHTQYFSLNGSASWLEPRINARYYLNEKLMLNAGYGEHSQMQIPYIYFYGENNHEDGTPIEENRNLGFTRGRNVVAGVEKFFGTDSTGFRVKVEGYYQTLYNVPVEKEPSAFSVINSGAAYTRLYPSALQNTGTARNVGVELTIEKPFARGYLFLLTGSLFDSKYRGSDGVLRNSDFNGKYTLNLLGTKELLVRKRNIFSVGSKVTIVGGRWYGPVDLDKSQEVKDVVYESGKNNTLQYEPYVRADLRLSYKINRKRFTHEVSVDIINLFNRRNALKPTFIPGLTVDTGYVVKEKQLGLMPFFSYKIEI